MPDLEKAQFSIGDFEDGCHCLTADYTKKWLLCPKLYNTFFASLSMSKPLSMKVLEVYCNFCGSGNGWKANKGQFLMGALGTAEALTIPKSSYCLWKSLKVSLHVFTFPEHHPRKFHGEIPIFVGLVTGQRQKKGVIFSAPTWPSTKLDKKRQFEKKEVIGLFPFFQLKLKSASFSFRACLLQSASSNWRSQKMRKKIKSWFCHFFPHILNTFLFLRNVQIFLHPHVDYQLNVSEIKKYSKSEHV